MPEDETASATAVAAPEAVEAPATPVAAVPADVEVPAVPPAPEAHAETAEVDAPAPPEEPDSVPVPTPSEEPVIVQKSQSHRQPPGGNSVINLSIDVHAAPIVRPPSGRAPPGGRATVTLGNEGPRGLTPKDPYHGTFRTLDGAKPEAIREVDQTPAKSMAHAVFSAEAISGAEVVHVPRIQAPTPSKLVFTEDGALYPDALPEKRVLMSAQKMRELSGNATNIFSGEELEHCVAEDPASSPDASSPSMVPADAKHIQGLLIGELRIALRQRGLNPAGGHQALVERLLEGIQAGAAPYLVPCKAAVSGMTSAAISNNYARSEGQNLGNFLTDRPSSRISRPPGGASQIVFGDEAPAQTPTFLRTVVVSDGKKQMLASTVFSEGAETASPTRVVNPAKTAHLLGQDIFKSDIAPAPHVSDAKKGELQGGIQGSGLTTGGSLAEPYLATVHMSEGKKLELSGHNSVFEPKGENAAAVVLSDAKLRELSGEASVEFFTGGKEGKVAELVKLSEGKQRELSGTRASDGAEKAYRPMSARIESGRNRQFGSIDNFKPQAEARRELSAAGQVKAQHLGGTVSLRDEVGPAAARNSTRVTQAPGGTSQIVFG